MIRDKLMISRLNRVLPGWRTEDGQCNPSEDMRKLARIQALKNLNLLYELVFEGDVNSRSRLSHRATSDVWAIVVWLSNSLEMALEEPKMEAVG